MAELMWFGVLAGLAVACIAVPMSRFSRSHQRGKPLWPTQVVTKTPIDVGAYRSSVLTETTTLYTPPKVVEAVALMSSFMGMAWLPALPFVGLGVLVELDQSALGPATVFGLAGIPLSIAIFVTGPRLLERRNPHSARGVAWWSILHNLAIVVATIVVTSARANGVSIFEDWQLYSLVDGVGWLALAYVLLSLVHGALMLRAADAVDASYRVDVDGEVLALG